MNLYTVLLLCATCISILLGLIVLSLNRKAAANRLFMIVMITNAYWAFCHFMTAQAPNMADAALWGKILSFWPFLDAFMLHFALIFTESRLLKNKLIYLVLYLPALFFSLIDLTTNLVYSGTVLQDWGYSNTISESVVGSLYGVLVGRFQPIGAICFRQFLQ